MTESTEVKFFSNENTGAPQLENTWGCLINVLDACLVTGFSGQPVSTLACNEGLVTVTFATAHTYKQNQVIKITGANTTELNGEFRILSIPNANTLTYRLSTAATLTTTGQITCSLPPLGWKKTYSGAQKAVYQANNGLDPMYLRVDDSCSIGAPETGAKFAKITVCDAMSGIDTFDGIQMPYNAQNPNRNHGFNNNLHGWFKWYHATQRNGSNNNFIESTPPQNGIREWLVVGDATFFVILNRTNMQENLYFIYGFGKVQNLTNDTDNYALLVSSVNATISTVVWHQIHDPISGARSDYRANSFIFFDKNGAPNYQQLQKFEMPYMNIDPTAMNGISEQQYSGRANTLEGFSTLGKYIGFDMFAVSQNLPVFRLPFIRSLAQMGSQMQWQDSAVCVRSNNQEGGQAAYLVCLKER